MRHWQKLRTSGATRITAFGVINWLASALAIGGDLNGLTLPTLTAYREGGGGSSVLRDSIRLQEIYASKYFPPHPIEIRELRWRPSALYGAAFTGRLERLQINMSASAKSPSQLSKTFAQNLGRDDTLVHDGPIELKSHFIGPKKGPKEFDIVVPLKTPFVYDPGLGNLLIDIRNHVAGPITFVDAGVGSGVARAFNMGADSITGAVGDGGSDAIQFCYASDRTGPPNRSGGLINGGFETGIHPGITVQINSVDTGSLAGWSVERGTVDYIGQRWGAAEGGRSVALRGPGGGVISQAITGLKERRHYRLSFQIAMNPEALLPSADLFVTIGAVSNWFSAGLGGDRSNLEWRRHVFQFAATAETMRLRLASRNPAWAGPIVDGLELVQIREPSEVLPTGQVFDLARDFRTGANPAGVWQMGWKETLDGRLILLSTEKSFRADNGVPIYGWQLGENDSPAVYKVVGPGIAISSAGQFVGPAGTVYITPGKSGAQERYGVARFTVPVGGGGGYRIETAVRDVFDGSTQGDSEFHVLKNGAELFGRLLAPHTTAEFTNDVALVESDTLDFVVGAGWDQIHEGSMLKLFVRVTSGVPISSSGSESIEIAPRRK